MKEHMISAEELGILREKRLEVEESAFYSSEGACRTCKVKLKEIVENKSLFDGAVTFCITKLKCQKCGKDYLNLREAEKYDLFLALEKMSKEEPLRSIAGKIAA